MFLLKQIVHRLIIGFLRFLAIVLPIPRPVLFVGEGASLKLCGAVAQMGARHVLLVTDSMLVSLGLHKSIVAEFDRLDLTTTIYDGVKPDPTYDQVGEGLALLKERGCDAVVALGGGSPIDAAKMISVMATNDKPVENFVGFLKVKNPGLPLSAIPTTAGTGSEVTVAAVVSHPETHLKTPVIDTKLVPSMAALDPTLMVGMPPAVTADTGLDALTHAVESYISVNSTTDTEAFARAAVRLVFENLPRAYADGGDLAAREAMAMASFYAGLAFTKTSVGYVHAIAHSFGAHYGTVHGRANAIVMPHVLEYSKGPAARRLAELARALELEGPSGEKLPDMELADRFIAEVRGLIAGLGVPDYLDTLKREDIAQIASEALHEGHYNYPVPRYMSRTDCERVIAGMLPTE